jgi:hypothetical protein
VITRPEDRSQFARLLSDGCQWGIRLYYAEQPKPEGIGQAFSIGADFIGSDRVVGTIAYTDESANVGGVAYMAIGDLEAGYVPLAHYIELLAAPQANAPVSTNRHT